MWQFLTPRVHALPPLCPRLKCGAPNSLLTPSLGLPKPALFFVTVVSFQEESAGATAVGGILAETAVWPSKIFLSAVLWELICLISIEGIFQQRCLCKRYDGG